MPLLSGGCVLSKGELLTNRDVNTFESNIGKKSAFCASGTFMGSFISAHGTKTLHIVFIFLFSVEGLHLLISPLTLGHTILSAHQGGHSQKHILQVLSARTETYHWGYVKCIKLDIIKIMVLV